MPKKTPENKETELFNWFDLKEVQDMGPKEEPYPYENTHIKINSRILCVGTTGSGKTSALLHYIHLMPGTFNKIIVYYKEREKLYDYLEKKLKGGIEFHNSLADLPTLAEMRKNAKEADRYLVVLDDYMMELNKYKNVADYFIYGRKKNITLFCLAQNYYTVPKPLRSQMTYLLLFFMTQQKDIKMVLSDFDTKDKVLYDIYQDAIEKDGSFLKITVGKSSPNERFSKGFTNFYTIKKD